MLSWLKEKNQIESMKRNQLVIYPKMATQHIQYQPTLNENEVEIPISKKITPLQIHANRNFQIKTKDNGQSVISMSFIHTDHASQNHCHALTEVHQDTIEILIKNPHISWTPNFTLFKNNGELICTANVLNESNFDFHTQDIKLVFRSVDHKYKKAKDDRDIPTIDSSNYVEYKISDQLDANFVLQKHYSVKLWWEKIELMESIHVNLEEHKPKYLDSYLSFEVPHLILPGEMEIVYRLENQDFLHLGTVYNQIHQKGSQMKIMFPMNKSIQIKNKTETKNHSFFIEKTTVKVESKIKKLYNHPIQIRFYTKRPVKSASLPVISDHDGFVWEHRMNQKEDTFNLEYTF